MSSPPTASVSTYHCICCTQLLLACPVPLAQLPVRRSDASHILPLGPADHITPHAGFLTPSALLDPTPLVVRLPDGFEKRSLLRCARCAVALGYRLDPASWAAAAAAAAAAAPPPPDVVFLWPRALLATHAVLDASPAAPQVESAAT